jgi:hypothetical protein
MCSPPVVIFAAQEFDIQQVEACQRPGTFRENVGYVEEVIRVNGMFRCRLAAHHALVLITFQAGHFQKSTQVVNLLLALTLLPDRRSSWYPAFFCCLTGGRFLGAVTEDTLNALMENALVFPRYMLLVYYFFCFIKQSNNLPCNYLN